MEEESSTTRTPHNWWNYSINPSSWHIQHNPNNNNITSCCDQEDHDVISLSANSSSFTNLTDGFSVDESSHRLVVDSAVAPSSFVFIGDRHSSYNNLWTNVLNQDVKETYLDALSVRSSVSLSGSRIFDEPSGACDYLKKMDRTSNAWELTNSTNSSLSNFDKYLNLEFVDNNFTNEGNRLANKLSSLVRNNSPFDSQPSLISLNSSSFDQYLDTDICTNITPSNRITSNVNHSLYGHDINVNICNRGNDEFEQTLGSLARRSFNGKYYEGLLAGSACTNGKSLNDNDAILQSQVSSKSLMDSYACKPSYKKQRPYFTSMVKGKNNGREGNSIGGSKKKRFEDNNSRTAIKKPKQENSTPLSIKMHPPKMKLGDKITSLQQIVSPFGKTDTASVLNEAIGCIKYLQERVQLLTNPYMKANANKDPWGNMEWNERGDKRHDLKSKGLCLVPISSAPQIYSENAGSDYWTHSRLR